MGSRQERVLVARRVTAEPPLTAALGAGAEGRVRLVAGLAGPWPSDECFLLDAAPQACFSLSGEGMRFTSFFLFKMHTYLSL